MTISSNTNLSTSLPLRDDGVLRGSVMLALFILLGLGLSYSLIATGITGALFPVQAHGSLLRVDARVVGSALVAQPFADARYFQPRPSAAKYDPTAAAGSNQARSNPDLQAHRGNACRSCCTRRHRSSGCAERVAHPIRQRPGPAPESGGRAGATAPRCQRTRLAGTARRRPGAGRHRTPAVRSAWAAASECSGAESGA